MPLRCDEMFRAQVPAVDRTDWYAFPCHQHSGIKFREGRLETKLLIDDAGSQKWGSVSGKADSWCKWSVEYAGEIPTEDILITTGWLAVHKRRHWQVLSMTDDSVAWQSERVENGCEVEWSVVTVDEKEWWTIGFEAVGELSDLSGNLSRAIEYLLGEQTSDTLFTLANSMAYPSWLWKVKTGGVMLPYSG